jgi:HAD superfamily hydrolase (TIGR01509 family)
MVAQLVWDMDGTLLDSGVAVPAAYVAAAQQLDGLTVTEADVVARYWRGVPERILADLLGRELTPAETDVYYDQLALAEVVPYPEAADVLAALRARGHPVAIFTGTSSRAAAMLLASAGLDADVVIGGDLVRRPKPAGDGLMLAATRLGVQANALAYVGDAPNDLRAARAVGGLAAAAAWGHQYDPAEPADVTLATPSAALDLLAPVDGEPE